MKFKKNVEERVAIPVKTFDVKVRKFLNCPSDRSDLLGLFCRKNLKDMDLPAFLLRVSAQI
ncbi:hypothetical protein DYI21_02480 [Thalassospira tepidiphila]|nr:hypothetical protein [Thalassospira tepidiphila]